MSDEPKKKVSLMCEIKLWDWATMRGGAAKLMRRLLREEYERQMKEMSQAS